MEIDSGEAFFGWVGFGSMQKQDDGLDMGCGMSSVHLWLWRRSRMSYTLGSLLQKHGRLLVIANKLDNTCKLFAKCQKQLQ